jgi:hypothetical protein
MIMGRKEFHAKGRENNFNKTIAKKKIVKSRVIPLGTESVDTPKVPRGLSMLY